MGLGSPPSAFYTNDSESINALLKESLNYKKQQWGIFNEKVKKIVQQQQREMEAVIGYGEYQLRQQYSFLAMSEEKWYRMSEDQRQRCIQKFNSCTVRFSDPNISDINVSDSASDFLASAQSSNKPCSSSSPARDITIGRFSLDKEKESQLSVPLKDAISYTAVPYTTVEGIRTKASVLVKEVNAIVPAPGFGPKDKMVKSKSGAAPHIVSFADGSHYKCDEKCPHFKSISICSHSVAAAEANGDLAAFLL